jgi:hypothetical protein
VYVWDPVTTKVPEEVAVTVPGDDEPSPQSIEAVSFALDAPVSAKTAIVPVKGAPSVAATQVAAAVVWGEVNAVRLFVAGTTRYPSPAPRPTVGPFVDCTGDPTEALQS